MKAARPDSSALIIDVSERPLCLGVCVSEIAGCGTFVPRAGARSPTRCRKRAACSAQPALGSRGALRE